MIFSAREILKMTKAGELFSGRLEEIKKEYANLANIWHPDHNKNSTEANEVMTHINMLYLQGINCIKAGKWEKPAEIKFLGKDGKVYEIKYLRCRSFELGKAYIGNSVVLYLIDDEHTSLFKNAEKVIDDFSYENDSMKREMSKYLPKVITQFEVINNQRAVVIEKHPDLVSLQDVLTYYEGAIPPRHAAWIINSLYNICCYLDYTALSHNSISLDTVFISPKNHNASLLGGWWYSVNQGKRMLGVPEKIYSIIPPHIKDKKAGSILTDLESVRLIGREILGDRNGTKLSAMGVPTPMSEYLRGAASSMALEDYSKWLEVLASSFGPRRFIQMDLDAEKLYKKVKD
jgi:hypothetical protein